MEAYAVEQIIDDVSRANLELALLDPNIEPDRLARCSRAVADLESVTAAILWSRWIPADAESLALSIRCVNDNLHRVEGQIDDVILDVIDRGQADEFLRVSVAMMQARLLELQREIMIDTLMKILPQDKMVN